jgi:RNA 2',3'-cyclic 3'-phosphodiesterase
MPQPDPSLAHTPMSVDINIAAPGPIEAPPGKIRPPRVFIGLKIAPEVAQRLAEIAQPLRGDGVRLVPESDIHLTLVPPWNEPDLAGEAEKLRKAIGGFGCFSLTFEYLRYGPTLRHPHLLWVECTATRKLAELRAALLAAHGQMDERPFRPHVTLARIPKNGRTIARKNPLDRTLSFTQQVTAIELFRSPPKGPGGYKVLASLSLGTGPSSTNRADDSLSDCIAS